MLLLVYCSFAVPYEIAFVQDEKSNLSETDLANLTINAIFLIDIALSFVTMTDVEGKLLRDLPSISLHYLQTWFIPDFAGSFPIDMVVAQAMEGSSGTLSAMRLIRLVRLVRTAKFLVKLKKLKEREGYEPFGPVLEVCNAVFVLFFTSHVFGCCFTMIANAEAGETWLLHYRAEYADADSATRYVTALYWAVVSITTMGYGDIYPVTHNERLFIILVAIVGAVVFSYCLGTISSLITQVAGIEDRHQQRLRAVQEYLNFRLVPPDLRRRACRHFRAAWKLSPAPYDELGILAELPPPLRAAVLRAVGERGLPRIPLLRGLDPECAGFVLTRLAPVALDASPAEPAALYRRGDGAADGMYLLLEGEVELAGGPGPAGGGAGAEGRMAGPGDTFGELGLFPDLAGPLRLDSATARGSVLALRLGPAQLADIAGAYPAVARGLRELAAALAADAAPAPHGGAAGGGGGGMGSGIAARVRRARKERVDRLERDLLLPLAARDGDGPPAVLRLLLLPPRRDPRGAAPVAADRGGAAAVEGARVGAEGGGARGASCVVSGDGEVLVVEHSPEGIAATAPRRLGRLVPGRSFLVALSESDEVVADLRRTGSAGRPGGGWGFVCALRGLVRAPPGGGGGAAPAERWEAEEEVLVALRTEEDRDCLARLVDSAPALAPRPAPLEPGSTQCGEGSEASGTGEGGRAAGAGSAWQCRSSVLPEAVSGRPHGAERMGGGGRGRVDGVDGAGWATMVLRAERALSALRCCDGAPGAPLVAAAVHVLAALDGSGEGAGRCECEGGGTVGSREGRTAPAAEVRTAEAREAEAAEIRAEEASSVKVMAEARAATTWEKLNTKARKAESRAEEAAEGEGESN